MNELIIKEIASDLNITDSVIYGDLYTNGYCLLSMNYTNFKSSQLALVKIPENDMYIKVPKGCIIGKDNPPNVRRVDMG